VPGPRIASRHSHRHDFIQVHAMKRRIEACPLAAAGNDGSAMARIDGADATSVSQGSRLHSLFGRDTFSDIQVPIIEQRAS